MNVDAFTLAYIEALLWSSSGELQSPLGRDANINEISPKLMERIESDCRNFQLFNGEHFVGYEVQAGHDFALTRNGHGAGFWDPGRPWSKEVGKLLTDAAHAVGELELYRGDDGRIYV